MPDGEGGAGAGSQRRRVVDVGRRANQNQSLDADRVTRAKDGADVAWILWRVERDPPRRGAEPHLRKVRPLLPGDERKALRSLLARQRAEDAWRNLKDSDAAAFSVGYQVAGEGAFEEVGGDDELVQLDAGLDGLSDEADPLGEEESGLFALLA